MGARTILRDSWHCRLTEIFEPRGPSSVSHSRSLRAPTPATPPPPPRRTRAWREGLRSLTPPSSRACGQKGRRAHSRTSCIPGWTQALAMDTLAATSRAPTRRTGAPPGPGLLCTQPPGGGPRLALGRRSSGFPHSPQGLESRRLPPHPSLRLGSRLQKIDKAVNRGAAGRKRLLGTRRYTFRANPSRSPARGPRGGPRLADSNTGNRGRALHSPRCFRQPHGGWANREAIVLTAGARGRGGPKGGAGTGGEA